MTSESPIDVIVAGHLCLDIIPTIDQMVDSFEQLIAPGKLINVGKAVMSTGGAVSNTGLAMHRLGMATRLVGKIGDDIFGRAVLDILRSFDGVPTDGVVVDAGTETSYTIVISPPGIDRCFLHCPGANDTFGPDDIPYGDLALARLLHFGYPPIMRRMYLDGGKDLAEVYRRAKETGVTTSLDMALPDPAAEAGLQDWVAIMERTLPNVDVFLPSFDEILYMLKPAFPESAFDSAPTDPGLPGKGLFLSLLAERLLSMGPSIVVLKLGEEGLYVRTTPDIDKLSAMGRCSPANPKQWAGREFIVPCLNVEVSGTVGAGDCTIAGFLAGMLQGSSLDEAALVAVAVGAFNVEKPDATSGIPSWDVLMDRMRSGWQHAETPDPGKGWKKRDDSEIWYGPGDVSS